MIELNLMNVIDSTSEKNNITINGKLILPIEQRVRSRFKSTLDNGREVGLFLPRGTLLRGGDLLCSADGLVIQIIAAAESVSTVHCKDTTLLTRAAYHLGNRHIPLQVENGWLRYQHDHVLDDMLRQMGLEVITEQAAFEPEAGAYQQAANGHNHSHSHDHEPEHVHEHVPEYKPMQSNEHTHAHKHKHEQAAVQIHKHNEGVR